MMTDSTSPLSKTSHTRLLVGFTLCSRLLFFVLLVWSSSFPLFDSSPNLISNSSWTSSLLRWDAFHFAHIAENGYVYEHEWAFFPGTPLVMRLSAELLRFVKGSSQNVLNWDDLLQGGLLAALACDTSTTLYHLSLHHLGSPTLALMASLLSLMPSSPVTLRFGAYAEPFFTYLSYKGMLYCARSRWFTASVLFALASAFRSNGILLSGFILWGLVIQPVLDGKKLSFSALTYAVLLTALTFIPFVYHNYAAYSAFCTESPNAPWCSNFPPSVYAYVQSTYWNVGLFRYWTLQQLPNFVISAPPLASIFYFSFYYLKHSLIPRLRPRDVSKPSKRQGSPFLSPTLSPHVLHALFLAMTLLFASHTQIILRLNPSMPITYWAAAWLLVEHPLFGRWWVGWSLVWGVTSVILWGNFLPPA